MLNEAPVHSEPIEWDYQDNSIQYDLPAFGMVAFCFDYVPPKKSQTKGSRARKSYLRKSAAKRTRSESKKGTAKKTGRKTVKK